jgi:5-methylcytosine-specific restriction endonuclease McrA
MAWTVCPEPGCPTITDGGRCRVHGRTSPRNHRGVPRQLRGYDRTYELARRQILIGQPRCYWGCGRMATTADHRIPLSEGGSAEDLVPTCAPCNYARGAEIARGVRVRR